MNANSRQLILETALRLFERDGYAATTMRSIAREAGVAPSHAYYWFDGKDALVQAFYERIQLDHRARVEQSLPSGSLATRLAAAEHAYLDVIGRFHGFGSAFVGTAINPRSTTSPFSAESAAARELSVQILREVVAGATPAVPKRVAGLLPELLWLFHLGITLFWVTDTSPGQERTRQLVDRSVPLLAGLVKFSRLPGATATLDQLREVLELVLPGEADE